MIFFFEKAVRIFIVNTKDTSITEDTSKLIILIILDARASLWKGQLTSRVDTILSKMDRKTGNFETVFMTMTKHVHGERKNEKVASLVLVLSKLYIYKNRWLFLGAFLMMSSRKI